MSNLGSIIEKTAKIFESLRTDSPSFSVVLPAKNEEKEIGQCLESLASSLRELADKHQVLGEVLVVDNSSDSTGMIANDCRVRVITETRGGVSQARNTGLMESHKDAKVILSTDADTLFPTGWAARHWFQLTENEMAQVVTGKIDIRGRDPKLSYLWDRTVWEQTMSYYRERAIEVGGYDVGFDLAEGAILAQRMIDSEDNLIYDEHPDSMVSVRELGAKGSWGYKPKKEQL